MKIVLNILKAFLINILFIGIIFASNSCPSISPKDAKDLPVEQAEAILGDILCSFIELHTEGNNTFFSALNLTKKKIIPYIDIETVLSLPWVVTGNNSNPWIKRYLKGI